MARRVTSPLAGGVVSAAMSGGSITVVMVVGQPPEAGMIFPGYGEGVWPGSVEMGVEG